MSLTFIGVLLLLIGLPIVLYGRIEALIALLIGCTVLGGSSAIDLPALGGSSIPPIHMALMLAGLRIFIAGSGQARPARAAISATLPLLLYAAYGVAMGVIGPRIFRGVLDVPPLRIKEASYIYAADPLAPTTQNLTTSVYLIGTFLCALVIHVMCSGRRGPQVMVKTAVVIAWVNVVLGIAVALTRNTAAAVVFDVFRNGSYAQLEQSYGNYVRLSGLFPEPSAYATYCFGWFCFLFECWYRDVMPRRTGPAALALFFILLASTSSSAYVSLGAYGVVLAARMLAPGSIDSAKITVMLLAGLLAVTVACVTFLVLPAAGAAFIEMVQTMTVSKGDSFSGLQRAFWARKGIEAFTASWGIGIGAGSFRSSSLLTAILGSVGGAGIILFAIHLLRVVKPLRASTYAPDLDERSATGVAAGWAALMLLAPYSVLLPSCDPGADFAIFSGAALALRAAAARRRGTAPPPPAAAPRGARAWPSFPQNGTASP